jgi:hypothetical protein
MHTPLRLRRVAALAIFALALSGCATMNVSSYVERGVDFTRYHTYQWVPVDSVPTGDPRLDNNPFFHERVEAEVEKQLAARGFEKTTSGTPDLKVHFHANMTQRIDVNAIDPQYGYCRVGDCRPNVYDAGTLLLDFVDTRTNDIVWRGWAEGSMEGVIDNQEWMEEKIGDAVARILEKLPPAL